MESETTKTALRGSRYSEKTLITIIRHAWKMYFKVSKPKFGAKLDKLKIERGCAMRNAGFRIRKYYRLAGMCLFQMQINLMSRDEMRDESRSVWKH